MENSAKKGFYDQRRRPFLHFIMVAIDVMVKSISRMANALGNSAIHVFGISSGDKHV
jgi:hypothetical protein